jgi:hypothetical protein
MSCAAHRVAWQHLQPAMRRTIELVATLDAAPLVERHVQSGDLRHACAVQVESELYARSGGRMTDAEWRELHAHRWVCVGTGTAVVVAVGLAKVRAACRGPHMQRSKAKPGRGQTRLHCRCREVE